VLFIGALDAITPGLIEAFGVDYRALKESWSRPSAANALATEPGGKAADTSVDTGQVFDQWADGAHATAENFSPRVTLGAIYDRYINIHRSDFALLRDPELIEAMGRRARQRVVADFSRDREADEISAVYQKVWATQAREPF